MTVEIPILNNTIAFDSEVYPSSLATEFSLTNAKNQIGIVMPYPTGSDLGLEGAFSIPSDYSSSPVLVIRAAIDGTPANTLAFGCQQISVDNSETIDVAYETEDLVNNSTWTGYADKDLIELTITLTPAAAYQPGDLVLFKFYRDDSVDTTTFNIVLLDLLFQYTEA